jgi:hypothetical protein
LSCLDLNQIYYTEDYRLFNRFGSDPDKTKQEVDDSSKVIGDSPLFKKFSSDTDMEVGLISILTEFEALLYGSSYPFTSG